MARLRAPRTAALFALLALGAMLLAACGSESAEPESSQPPGVSDRAACNAAFEELSRIADLREEDLDPAVRACATIEDWEAAADAFPNVLSHSNKVLPLSNRCRALDNPPICRQLGGYLRKADLNRAFSFR